MKEVVQYNKFLLLLTFILYIFNGFSSVDNNHNLVTIDTSFVNSLNEKSSKYIISNVDSGIAYAELAIHYGNLIDYQKGVCLGYINKATGFWIKTQYDKALTLYGNSLELSNKINFNECMVRATNGIANVYYQYGNHAKALEYYLISLKYSKQCTYRRGESVALNNIGIIFSEQNDYHKALEYLNLSKKISYELLDTHLYMMTLNYIGTIHFKLNNYKESINKHSEALEYFKKHDATQRIAESYNYLANNYLKLEAYDIAEKHYQTALEHAKKYKGGEHECNAILGISNILFIRHQYKDALYWASMGLELAQTANLGSLLPDYYLLISQIHEKLGNVNLAFHNFKEYNKHTKTIFNTETEKRIAFLSAQYEFEKKEELLKSEQKIQSILHKQEISNWRAAFFIGIIILLFTIASIAFILRSKRNLKNANNQLEIAYNEINKQKTELIQLNSSKDKFFSIIAHDLRSPLNVIEGYSGLLIEQIKQKKYDKISLYSKAIFDSTHRAINLLMNLMEWAQSQTGRMKIKPEHFDLSKFIHDNVLLYEDISAQKGIIIEKKIPQNAIVFGDKDMINTVLRNLISNSIKFSQKGGKITISITEEKNKLIISVNDNGIGISNDRVQKLFRIDSSESTPGTNQEKGTGLGLILCKEFVEKHQGEIWVESEEEIGTTFFFSLPYDPDVVFEPNIEQPSSIVRYNEVGNLTILVVEDEEISEMLIDNHISMFGKEILKAKTGFEAIEICLNNPDIDLILMDIRIQNIDGYEATSIIREFNKDVIIIAQTAYGLTGEKEIALNSGCNDYISKPIKKVEFQTLIQKYFGKI